jgi:hypothetical protein
MTYSPGAHVAAAADRVEKLRTVFPSAAELHRVQESHDGCVGSAAKHDRRQAAVGVKERTEQTAACRSQLPASRKKREDSPSVPSTRAKVSTSSSGSLTFTW